MSDYYIFTLSLLPEVRQFLVENRYMWFKLGNHHLSTLSFLSKLIRLCTLRNYKHLFKICVCMCMCVCSHSHTCDIQPETLTCPSPAAILPGGHRCPSLSLTPESALHILIVAFPGNDNKHLTLGEEFWKSTSLHYANICGSFWFLNPDEGDGSPVPGSGSGHSQRAPPAGGAGNDHRLPQ